MFRSFCQMYWAVGAFRANRPFADAIKTCSSSSIMRHFLEYYHLTADIDFSCVSKIESTKHAIQTVKGKQTKHAIQTVKRKQTKHAIQTIID